MRAVSIFWLIHFLATVSGWYALGGLAQGVADGTGLVPPPLVVLNEIIEILLFPLVISVLWFFPAAGGYSITALLSFVVTAAANSAIVAVAITSLVRALRRRMATR